MGQTPKTSNRCGAPVLATFIVVSSCVTTGCIPHIDSDPYPEVWATLKKVPSGSCATLDGEYVVIGQSGNDDRTCPTLTAAFFGDHPWGVVRTVRLWQDDRGRLMVEALDGGELIVRQRIEGDFVKCTSDGVRLAPSPRVTAPESVGMILARTQDNDLAIKTVSSSTTSAAPAPVVFYERTSAWCLYPLTQRSEQTEGARSHEVVSRSPVSEVASVLELDDVEITYILETNTRFLAFNDLFGWPPAKIELPPGAYRIWFRQRESLWSSDVYPTRVVNANLITGHRYVMSTSDDGSRIYDMTSGETTVIEH